VINTLKIVDEHRKDNPIIVFDGYCNFCSGSVMFIIRRDPGLNFRFTASQAEAGRRILEDYNLAELAEHSLILIKNERIYYKSGAALRIARQLHGLWPLFYGFIVVPGIIRDLIYDFLARNRYRLYGKRAECFLPGEDIPERFL